VQAFSAAASDAKRAFFIAPRFGDGYNNAMYPRRGLPQTPLGALVWAGVYLAAGVWMVFVPTVAGAPLMQLVQHWFRFLFGCGLLGLAVFYIGYGLYLLRE
jgi:hypothetical protein